MILKRIISNSLASLITITAMAQHSSDVISYLEIYDFETRTHSVLKEFPFIIEAPNWTPDGRWIGLSNNAPSYKAGHNSFVYIMGSSPI